MASTTTDTETELSAVNAVLGAIGQLPISVLKDPNSLASCGLPTNCVAALVEAFAIIYLLNTEGRFS